MYRIILVDSLLYIPSTHSVAQSNLLKHQQYGKKTQFFKTYAKQVNNFTQIRLARMVTTHKKTLHNKISN